MTRPIGVNLLLFLLSPLASLQTAQAHHSPNEVVEKLSERIDDGERTVTLFIRRGDEYRAVGDDEAAIVDYLAALALHDENQSALFGLANAHLAQGQWDEARRAVERGLAVAKHPDEAGPFHAIAARSYSAEHQWSKALESWQKSLTSSRPDIDWFLGEVQALQSLSRTADALHALEIAKQRNPSAVLEREWIKLLIENGNTLAAAPYIEAGLERVRWKSSWLLLRAQLSLVEGQTEAARQDALTALAEIDSRLRPDVRNPFLIAARGAALAILGRNEEAQVCAAEALEFGVVARVVGLHKSR